MCYPSCDHSLVEFGMRTLKRKDQIKWPSQVIESISSEIIQREGFFCVKINGICMEKETHIWEETHLGSVSFYLNSQYSCL